MKSSIEVIKIEVIKIDVIKIEVIKIDVIKIEVIKIVELDFIGNVIDKVDLFMVGPWLCITYSWKINYSGWVGGWLGGWVVGAAENIAISAFN